MRVLVDRAVRNEGTIVLFAGTDEKTNKTLTFAADHRPARDILDALEDNDEPIYAEIERWQIID